MKIHRMHFYRGVRSHSKFRGDFGQFSSLIFSSLTGPLATEIGTHFRLRPFVQLKQKPYTFRFSELKNRLKRQNRSKSPRLTVLEKKLFWKNKKYFRPTVPFQKGLCDPRLVYFFWPYTESLRLRRTTLGFPLQDSARPKYLMNAAFRKKNLSLRRKK